MPFKLKIIKNIKKHIENYNKTSNEEEKNKSKSVPDMYNPQKQKQRRLVSSVTNIYQVMLQKVPFSQRHIVNFFNIISINEDALKSQDCQETYFRTVFYNKSIRKVVSKPRYIVLHLVDSEMYSPPLEYSIERFKSFGDEKYHRMALLLEKAAQKFGEVNRFQGKEAKENNNDQIQQYVESLGNRIFCCKGGNKIYLSNSLIETLEFEPENFAIEAVKNRASFYEAYSAEKYFEVMEKNFQNLINLVDLILNRTSLETFLNSSIIRYQDTLYTRTNKKIFGKVKTGMPNPHVNMCELEEILYVSEEIEKSPYFSGSKKKQLSMLREKKGEDERQSLRHLTPVPESYFKENKTKVSGYIEKSTSQNFSNDLN